jgi:Phosphoesterase family
MGFFNMQQGDAPVFKALADQFTLSDNYHQPVFGGTWADSMVQWVDFFGTGPRIPLIAVSPFSTGGHVSHVYGEHSSFVKFIERNWKLSGALSDRSRDNLPNPLQNNKNPMCRRICRHRRLVRHVHLSLTPGPRTPGS